MLKYNNNNVNNKNAAFLFNVSRFNGSVVVNKWNTKQISGRRYIA
jgi:hypothetical protein